MRDITLINGDCREILSAASVDWSRVVLITDPVWPDPMTCLPGAEEPWELWAEMWYSLPALPKRAIVHLGQLSDPRFLGVVPEELEFATQVSLDYPVPGFVGRYVVGGDRAYLFGPPPATWETKMVPGRILATGDREENGHPCPRSLGHVRELVGLWSEPDDIILDPFAGSGTTLLAAQYWGREAIGIEVSPEFTAVAHSRLRANDLALWSLKTG